MSFRPAVAAAAGTNEAKRINDREALKAANAMIEEAQLLNIEQEKTIVELRRRTGVGEFQKECESLKEENRALREKLLVTTPRSEMKLMPTMTPQQKRWYGVGGESGGGGEFVGEEEASYALVELRSLRRDYVDLESEHEDLLALLAQQEIEKSVMRKRIEEGMGEEELDSVAKEAEQVTKTKFGQFIVI